MKVVGFLRIAPKKDALTESLIKKGLSKSELGEMVGVGSSYAIQICNGTRHPGPRTAKRICDVLGVEFDDIFIIKKTSVS